MSALPPDRDLGKLDPTFRERVTELVRRMNAAGYDAYVFEGWRSFARADELQKRGSGIAKSMHCYGVAADILSRRHMWSANELFWARLGHEAKALGLTWGGDWQRVDRPHVQALPAARDAWVRNAQRAQLAEEVARHLAHSDPADRPTQRENVRAKAIVPGSSPPAPTPLVSPRAAIDAPRKDGGDER